jgi:hypothetical protein
MLCLCCVDRDMKRTTLYVHAQFALVGDIKGEIDDTFLSAAIVIFGRGVCDVAVRSKGIARKRYDLAKRLRPT